MNEMQIFNNPEFGNIRSVIIDGEPWFVGKDVARALGYCNPSKAVFDHVDDEDKRFEMLPVSDSQNGNLVKTALINESGVYSLTFSSKLPSAKKFKRWVTAEVLPAIRKQGGYLTPEAAEQLAAAIQTQSDLTDAIKKLDDRVTSLEGFGLWAPRIAAAPAMEETEPQAPGKAYMKRWMRTISEKLDLMSNKFNMSNNAILHQLYGLIEEEFGVVLADERLRIMEDFGLEDCSTLKAIFYEEDFRDSIQRNIDHNLAPENRGW